MQTVTQIEKKKGWRWGVNRWFVLAFMIASFFAAKAYPPIQPHVQLPAEVVFHTGFNLFGQEVNITNTIIAMLVADVIILLIALGVRRATREESAVPKGISSAVEALLEALYNLTEGTAGKWTKQIFPVFATIVLMVLVWNWTELIPGVDSIGWIEPVHAEGVHGFAKEEILPGFFTIVKGDVHSEEEMTAEGEHEEDMHAGDVHAEGEHADQGYMIVPFVRVASTDLNFTIALALIAVVAVQYIGFKSNGVGYLTKFWNTKTLFKVPIFGVIDFAVGILELISEVAKVLSFSFRLFGNIFAGSVLLFVIGSLVPVFAQSGFLMLEFFIGLIQAIVFGMLTMVFMAQATESHGHDDH
jgi:F-type H+-transporting ATPase subunit a